MSEGAESDGLKKKKFILVTMVKYYSTIYIDVNSDGN